MSQQAKVLIVDDAIDIAEVLADLLEAHGYKICTAATGPDALTKIEREQPDLVLLDVMMPGMSGYEVCRKIRENPSTVFLPVVMLTGMDANVERIKGIEAGADDFLSKPPSHPELLARVRSLIRIKQLHDTVQAQMEQLAEWNKMLETRVQEQVAQLERLERLKRFFSPQLAELIVTGGAEDPLKTHRRQISVVFIDLRGFTAFAETNEPEEVMDVLWQYHAALGPLILEHEGTLERFTGDGMMVFFNDPIVVPNPEERAVRVAVAMRDRIATLQTQWIKRGYELGLGAGITAGYATIGAIGFEGRRDYAAIGTVPNLAARLCDQARPGQVLISQRLYSVVESLVEAESVGEMSLKGLQRPMQVYNIRRLRR
ncbi:MAG TPA: response regulator [Candidatus Binatia bacterium]|jgi:class 3 adenylate cyclase/CheY-like chemotaxis protein